MVYVQFILFAFLLLYFLWGLRVVKYFNSSKYSFSRSEPNTYPSQLTVIVPFKNESTVLPGLLFSLNKALDPLKHYEVLFIDDHSTDDGADLIQTYGNSNFKVIKSEGDGKKAAIEAGVERAQYSHIFTTDADCELPDNCFEGIRFGDKKFIMTCGAVLVKNESGFLASFQHIESLILAFLSGSFIKAGNPLTCSGANLFFTKELFGRVNPYEGNHSVNSGDDHFFLQKTAVESLGDIFWNDSRNPVLTKPQTTFKSVLNQKERWAGKLKHGGGADAVFNGLFLAVVQLSFLFALVFGIIYGDVLLLTLAGCKVLTDIMLAIVPKHFYNSRVSLFYIVVSALSYAGYFFVVLLFAVFWSGQFKKETER